MHFSFFAFEQNEPRTSECEPEHIEKIFILNSAQYRIIRRWVSDYKFWQTQAESDYITQGGFSWVIEGAEHNRYHMVQRHTPRYGNVASLGGRFFEFAFLLLRDSEYSQNYIIVVVR
jgi:hypothetical protein